MKVGIIDRFEKGVDKDFAILELDNRELLIIEKDLLPEGLNEGDEVQLDDFNHPVISK